MDHNAEGHAWKLAGCVTDLTTVPKGAEARSPGLECQSFVSEEQPPFPGLSIYLSLLPPVPSSFPPSLHMTPLPYKLIIWPELV